MKTSVRNCSRTASVTEKSLNKEMSIRRKGGPYKVFRPVFPITPGGGTTKAFLLEFGLETLRDLPDFEALEDAGLLSKEKLLAGDIVPGISSD